MAADPAGARSRGGPRATEPPAADAGLCADGPAQAERYGPLAVRRLRKDDGRALLLYSRADDAAEAQRP